MVASELLFLKLRRTLTYSETTKTQLPLEPYSHAVSRILNVMIAIKILLQLINAWSNTNSWKHP